MSVKTESHKLVLARLLHKENLWGWGSEEQKEHFRVTATESDKQDFTKKNPKQAIL